MKENLEDGNNFELTSLGWYTFEHSSYELGGTLAVDLNLYDDAGSLLFTETPNNAGDDTATGIGGLFYSRFTLINMSGGIAINNVEMLQDVPAPAALSSSDSAWRGSRPLDGGRAAKLSLYT